MAESSAAESTGLNQVQSIDYRLHRLCGVKGVLNGQYLVLALNTGHIKLLVCNRAALD